MSMDMNAIKTGGAPPPIVEPPKVVPQPQVQVPSQVAPLPQAPPQIQHLDQVSSSAITQVLDQDTVDAFKMADVQTMVTVPDDITQKKIEKALDKGIVIVDEAQQTLQASQVNPLANDSDGLPDGLEGAFAKMAKLMTDGPRTPGDSQVIAELHTAWQTLGEELNQFQDSPAASNPELQAKLQASIDHINAAFDQVAASDPGFKSMLVAANVGTLPSAEDMQKMHDAVKAEMNKGG